MTIPVLDLFNFESDSAEGCEERFILNLMIYGIIKHIKENQSLRDYDRSIRFYEAVVLKVEHFYKEEFHQEV